MFVGPESENHALHSIVTSLFFIIGQSPPFLFFMTLTFFKSLLCLFFSSLFRYVLPLPLLLALTRLILLMNIYKGTKTVGRERGADGEDGTRKIKAEMKAQQRGVQHSLESQKDSGRLIY